MKIFQTGLFCACLLAFSGSVANAQEPAQGAAVEDPQQNPTSQNPASQNPTSQSPQTPAPRTPTPQTPAEQAGGQQPPTGPIVNAPPELPKYPDVRLPGEYGWYLGVDAWFPKQNPSFNKGRNSGITNNSYATLEGTPKLSQGFEVGIAVGLHNMLKASFFDTRAAGDFTPSANFTAWGQTYTAGTLLSTDYNLQNFKLSFEYLTWPYPVESRKFRLKTLWQVQYTSARTTFNAPLLPLTDSSGNPIIDANTGNPISYVGEGSRWFIIPTLGLSATEFVTRNVRIEMSGDGFAIPHHSTLWEGEASANVRVSRFELRAGAKAFHFKTSTGGDFYVRGTLASVFFGIRWYSR